MKKRDRALLWAAVTGAVALQARASSEALAANAYDWLQFNGDAQHSGNNTHETVISSGNVAQMTQLFQVTLPAVADSAPAVLTAVSTGSGAHDLLFINTKTGLLLALDAHTGATVWSSQHAGAGCTTPGGACITESSPAVDPGRSFVYAYGIDGNVHKNNVATGAEISTGGWPEAATIKPDIEKGASALTVAVSGGAQYLYATNGAVFGDPAGYSGHVTTINLASGAQTVWNAMCSDQTVHFVESGSPNCTSGASGIWARSGVVYDADLDKILVSTGNGEFVPSLYRWGDSALMLNPNGTGAGTGPVDSYTPTTFQTLQDTDADLGSTAPAILPTPAGFPYPHVALQAGKDGHLRLLNLDNMSNQGTGRQAGRTGGELALLNVPPNTNLVSTAIASWVNPADGTTWAFLANSGGTSGLKLTANGSAATMTTMWTNTSAGGSSPLVANGVVYVAGPSRIDALAPTTGALLWQGTVGAIHWESPVVANGVLYVADESAHLTAFSVAGASAAVPAVPSRVLWLAAAALLFYGLLRAGLAPSRASRADRDRRTS
jgi:hypothetical protein